jgi:hypothetical protein
MFYAWYEISQLHKALNSSLIVLKFYLSVACNMFLVLLTVFTESKSKSVQTTKFYLLYRTTLKLLKVKIIALYEFIFLPQYV